MGIKCPRNRFVAGFKDDADRNPVVELDSRGNSFGADLETLLSFMGYLGREKGMIRGYTSPFLVYCDVQSGADVNRNV
jgi:hypothetical protein